MELVLTQPGGITGVAEGETISVSDKAFGRE